MEFITAYWAYAVIVFLAADKIVTITPNKYDDLIFTAIKGAWKAVKPSK